jgi:hypothetical protein
VGLWLRGLSTNNKANLNGVFWRNNKTSLSSTLPSNLKTRKTNCGSKNSFPALGEYFEVYPLCLMSVLLKVKSIAPYEYLRVGIWEIFFIGAEGNF